MSFNEWIEGTQIEPASISPPDDSYLTYGNSVAEDFYLSRTKYWTTLWTSRSCGEFNQSHWTNSQYESDIVAYFAAKEGNKEVEDQPTDAAAAQKSTAADVSKEMETSTQRRSRTKKKSKARKAGKLSAPEKAADEREL
eukprot:SAG31_NODE_6360_length_2044_cov_1.253470_2_plen_139_part_00